MDGTRLKTDGYIHVQMEGDVCVYEWTDDRKSMDGWVTAREWIDRQIHG